jgi:hypothetical protein
MQDQAQAPPFEAFGVIRSAGMTRKTLPCRFCGGVAIVAGFGLRGGAATRRSRARLCTDARAVGAWRKSVSGDELQPHSESTPARCGRTVVLPLMVGRANGSDVKLRGQGPAWLRQSGAPPACI